MLHWCTILSAQRLSWPVDCNKATEAGSDLAQGVSSVLDAHFKNLQASAERALWFTKYRAICQRFLQSEGYTKAWILGLTVCFTTDLEDLNVTDKYCEPEQASTVKSNHRTQVGIKTGLAFPDSLVGFEFIVSTDTQFYPSLMWMATFGYSSNFNYQVGSYDNR